MVVLPAGRTPSVALQPAGVQAAEGGEAPLDADVAAGLVGHAQRLVEPDRHPRPEAEHEARDHAGLRLGERVRSRVLEVPGAPRGAPAPREVAVEVDVPGIDAR